MLIVALSGCFFESVHAVNWFFEDTPAGKALEQLKRGLRIPVSSFVHTVDFHVMDQWYYTTELSRILLVGEHRFFEHVRYVPAIGGLLSLPGPLFDNRFEYITRWVPEWQTVKYPKPMVEHSYARDRALKAYKASSS